MLAKSFFTEPLFRQAQHIKGTYLDLSILSHSAQETFEQLIPLLDNCGGIVVF